MNRPKRICLLSSVRTEESVFRRKDTSLPTSDALLNVQTIHFFPRKTVERMEKKRGNREKNREKKSGDAKPGREDRIRQTMNYCIVLRV
jgi:hypothetical protein